MVPIVTIIGDHSDSPLSRLCRPASKDLWMRTRPPGILSEACIAPVCEGIHVRASTCPISARAPIHRTDVASIGH